MTWIIEQTFVPPSHWGSTWNLASTGPAVSEKMFENGADDVACLYYKLSHKHNGSGELIKNNGSVVANVVVVLWFNVLVNSYGHVKTVS